MCDPEQEDAPTLDIARVEGSLYAVCDRSCWPDRVKDRIAELEAADKKDAEAQADCALEILKTRSNGNGTGRPQTGAAPVSLPRPKPAARPVPVPVVPDVPLTMGETEKVALFDELHTFLADFVAYPNEHAHIAHTLWVGHTYLMDRWESTPRIAFLSPEPASGKTRALEITQLVTPNPVEAVNVSAAYLFRKVAECPPTVLFDEIDTVFGPRAKEHEDVRGLLNAGHRRGAVAGRCVLHGKTVVTEELPAYCAVALAGLGDLPDTILTRSVIIRMRRRAPSEAIKPFRRREESERGVSLYGRLATFAAQASKGIGHPWPAMPEGIEDRDADVWEPLLAVADAVGGRWPALAREAAIALVKASKESTPSLGIRLLADLRKVFREQDAMTTEDILAALCRLEEAPWGEITGGKPLNARGLARRLGQYGIKSEKVRAGAQPLQGYKRESLFDAWERYLPSFPNENGTSGTSGTEEPEYDPFDVSAEESAVAGAGP